MSSARFSAGIARIRPGRAQLLFLFQPGDQRLRTDDLVAQTHLHVGIRRKEQIDPRAELDEAALGVLLGPPPYPGIRNDPPRNKEEYYYRTIFEECFPSQTAAQCVPSVPSVACSTAEALAWDESFRNLDDPSGRAVQDVHRTARNE